MCPSNELLKSNLVSHIIMVLVLNSSKHKFRSLELLMLPRTVKGFKLFVFQALYFGVLEPELIFWALLSLGEDKGFSFTRFYIWGFGV